MAEDKVQKARDILVEILGSCGVSLFDSLGDSVNAPKVEGWEYSTKEDIADALIAAVREDEKRKCADAAVKFAMNAFDINGLSPSAILLREVIKDA